MHNKRFNLYSTYKEEEQVIRHVGDGDR